jgi:hypothetical protein
MEDVAHLPSQVNVDAAYMPRSYNVLNLSKEELPHHREAEKGT